jgi:uroporphyrinogen-III decarboxylase
MPDVERIVKEEKESDGTIKKYMRIRTPAGEISEVFVTPAGRPGFWQEHLVKSEADLAAFAYLVETNAQTLRESPTAREKIHARLKTEADLWPDQVPLYLTIGVPAFSLTCNLYMATPTAFYLLADHPEFMDRLFEAETQANTIVVECAARAGADFVLGAINGLEIFSPAIYRNYFVPQARMLHETAHHHGMRGWVHTCGHMNKLIDMGVYEPMGVDVLESLSYPPLGDVTDLNAARKKLGNKIVTRGGINVGLFYENDLTKIREQTKEVLKEVRGFRHMVGDTNHPFPPYRRDNILAMAEEVRKTGRMLIF